MSRTRPRRAELAPRFALLWAALLLPLSPPARGDEFPSETNVIVNTVPAQIGAGSKIPIQFLGINYTKVNWTASSAYLAVLSDSAGLLSVKRLDIAPGFTVGYIRQYCFTTMLTAPASAGTKTLKLQMALGARTPAGLQSTLSIKVKPSGRLQAKNLQLSPSTLYPGVTARIGFTLRNTGSASCQAQRLQVWASPDSWFWSTHDPARFGWQRAAAPTGNPAPRMECAMAYDSRRGRTILFGGDDDRQIYGDTWEYTPPEVSSSPGWRNLRLAGPPARSEHAMAFDAARGKVVLFGGYSTAGHLGDTWEYTPGAGWKKVAASGPAPRRRTALVYDSGRGKMVLFGGQDSTRVFSDTWEYTPGKGWGKIATAKAPAARANHAMAYDSKRGRILLAGGRGYGLTGDMWQYTPAAGWVQLSAGKLPPHEGQAMIYDPKLDRALFFGGWDGDYRGETWEWRDGQGWRTIPALGPATRAQYGCAYDSARGKMMIFGGWDSYFLGDTWELLCGGNDIFLGEVRMAALASGASASYSINLGSAALGIPGRLPPGTYKVGLVPDALNESPLDDKTADVFAFPQTLRVSADNAAKDGWHDYSGVLRVSTRNVVQSWRMYE